DRAARDGDGLDERARLRLFLARLVALRARGERKEQNGDDESHLVLVVAGAPTATCNASLASISSSSSVNARSCAASDAACTSAYATAVVFFSTSACFISRSASTSFGNRAASAARASRA